MIDEYRTYKVAKGRMSELIERFQKHTLRLFSRHQIQPVIFSYDESNDMFKYVVSFPSTEAQKASWESFMNDPERVKIWEDSNKNGKLVEGIESLTLESVLVEDMK
uniref:NIPSNAP protein n=1 Tax=Candidatus Kentrum sp. FW TaxID=2126338 RepID=A0A450THX6_9GAMM|nr:MAG: NIPSNAP protein [Candidatus Kentron sp. FW]